MDASLYQAIVIPYLLLLTIRRAATNSYQGSNSSFCRCSTFQPCFPGTAALRVFNESVGGRLIVPHPTAYSCYPGAGFDGAECSMVQANSTDGLFRATIPGSMQSWNIEELGIRRCPLETANNTYAFCDQARVPVYGVAAESVADIQATVKFAVANNLRLFIKSTGHDYLGRSAAVGSFMLWLHKLNSQVISQSFIPAGCMQAAVGPVVTIAGGPQFWDVYAAISNQTNDQYVLIGGFCPSVGAAGGYALGGGHGPLSPSFGMAVDHLLQFEMVTADGELRWVNQCTDPDLFWALKGGGGGTYGVVTSVTYQLQASPPNLASFQINVTPIPNGTLLTEAQVQQLVTIFYQQAGNIDGARWGGYFELNNRVGFAGTFLLPMTVAAAQASVGPFVAAWAPVLEQGWVEVYPRLLPQTSFWSWRENHVWPGTNFDPTGGRGVIGTRLIPFAEVLANPTAVGKAVAEAAFMADNFVGFVTAGQGVRERDSTSQETSVNPAWRKAFMQVEVLYMWDYDTLEDVIDGKKTSLNSALDIWRQAWPNSPDSGVYFNEAAFEPDWQKAYWGTNYDRLLRVKERVDPNDVFMCTQCVGSEGWDSTGNCKI